MLRSPCVATVGFSNRAKNLQRLTGHAENLGYFLPAGAIWQDIFSVDSATVPQKRKNPVVRSPDNGGCSLGNPALPFGTESFTMSRSCGCRYDSFDALPGR